MAQLKKVVFEKQFSGRKIANEGRQKGKFWVYVSTWEQMYMNEMT